MCYGLFLVDEAYMYTSLLTIQLYFFMSLHIYKLRTYNPLLSINREMLLVFNTVSLDFIKPNEPVFKIRNRTKQNFRQNDL